MRYSILFISILFCCTIGFRLSAQEIKADALGREFVLPKLPLVSIDSTLFRLTNSDPVRLKLPEELMPALMIRDWKHLSYIRKSSDLKKPVLPIEFSRNFNFNINPSRWELPVLGATTTFSPTLAYQPFDRMFLYGGVNFTQYHNLSYVQHIIAPNWPAKSNITIHSFGGFAYVLHDRITLHGTYQQSLSNPLPNNLMMFSPAFKTISVGADVDVWNGLGISVDRVFEIDRNGRVYQGMRYSPYINFNKFAKFLRGY